MSSRRRSGFTLAEALLSLLIFALVLGAFALLCVDYSRLSRFSGMRDRTLQAANLALQKIRAEAADALVLTRPSDATPVSDILLTRINPEATSRLPVPPGTPSGWAPKLATHCVDVRYYVANETLFREAGPVTEPIAYGMQGLTASINAAGNLEVRLSVVEANQIRALSSEVFLPLRW